MENKGRSEKLGKKNAKTKIIRKENSIILANDVLPEEIVLVPLNDSPVFPGMILPFILSSHLLPTLEFIVKKKEGWVGMVYTHEDLSPEKEMIKSEEVEKYFYSIGSAGKVLKWSQDSQGDIQVLVSVLKRFKRKSIRVVKPYLIAQVKYYEPEENIQDIQIRAYVAALIAKIRELIKLNSMFSEEMKLFISRYGSQNPGHLADLVTTMLTNVSGKEIQDILETFPLRERLPKVLTYVHKEVEVSRVKERINKQVEGKISKQQKEFFLREQLKQIKNELGLEKDEKTEEIAKLKAKISGRRLSEEAKQIAEEELEKLRLYDVRSSEYSVSRNYLGWICSLPWGITTGDHPSLTKAKKILNEDHYGLDQVKERILEFVAIQKLKASISGSILCFVGPPGVGKTSLGKSIARALGRKFYNFSLGGMRDEAEIKGHRRTYIGAMPGKVIQALKSVGASDPVIMLDEVDKIHASYQGDPAASLLEVLDPEQNSQFLDHYLDMRFDLSKILFLATANQEDTIPEPLLDRMETLRLSGYILQEKREIAKNFIIPRQIKEHGLKPSWIQFSGRAVEDIVRFYAREAGVRALEKQIKKILRKTAHRFVRKKPTPVKIDRNIRDYLGTERFKDRSPYDKVEAGIVSGLAWTALGGSVLYIESLVVSKKKGEGKLSLTGQLGKVMEESAQLAYAHVWFLAGKKELDENFFADARIHIHVPEGATPKDGPSAGITIALSLFSLASGKAVSKDLAMTGEMTVTGRVLPVGGIREKLIGAKRAAKKRIILPLDNKKDVDDLPAYLRKGLRISFAKTFEDVTKIAFKR